MKRLPLVVTVLLLAIAGTAGAFLLRGRRDVTTSSAEALRHDPHFVMATVRLAMFVRQRDPERAKSLLECASRCRDEITPREELAFRIAESQMKGDSARTETLVDEYAKKYPQDPEAYQLKAVRFARKGKVAEAVAEFQRLLAVNPNYAYAYNSLGYYYAKMGDFAKGEDYLKRYRFLAPDQANPYDSLGELYANTGRYDEAEESLKKALAIKRDFFPAHGHLGTVALGRGDFGTAGAEFLLAADLVDTPGMKVEFAMNAAFSFASAGRTEDAKKAMDRMESEYASAGEAERKLLLRSIRMSQSAVFARLGETERSEAFLKQAEAAAAAAPKTSEKYDPADFERSKAAITGLLAHVKGDHAAAVASLEKAIAPKDDMMGGFDYVPYQSLMRVALAENLRQLGRFDDAQNALKSVLARNPHFQPAVAEMARLKEAPTETGARRS